MTPTTERIAVIRWVRLGSTNYALDLRGGPNGELVLNLSSDNCPHLGLGYCSSRPALAPAFRGPTDEATVEAVVLWLREHGHWAVWTNVRAETAKRIWNLKP